MPSVNGCDDLFWVGCPDEWFGLLVVLFDEAVDGSLKIDDRVEHTAFEPPFGELCEEAFDSIQPGCGCRCEVEGPARMTSEPLANLFMFVRAVVVEDDVDHLARRNVALDDVQEAKEFLMPMAFHVAADDRTVEDVKGGKQGCRAMAFIIMSKRA